MQGLGSLQGQGRSAVLHQHRLRRHIRQAFIVAQASSGCSQPGKGQVSTASIAMAKLPRTSVVLGPPGQRCFKLMQWNVLADGLAQHGDFIKVSPQALEWERRLPLMLSEIEESDADVVCIQELNRYDELRSHLAKLGYDGCFLPKHCSPAARYMCPADGLAIFFRTSRFTLTGPPQGTYYTDEAGVTASQGFLKVGLQEVGGGDNRRLVVVTTHLKAKEGRDMDVIRLRQMRQLLAGIAGDMHLPQGEQAATEAAHVNGNGNGNGVHHQHNGNGTGGGYVPVIITGDFNTTPGSLPCKELHSHLVPFTSMWDVPVLGTSQAAQLTTSNGNGNGNGSHHHNGNGTGHTSAGSSHMAYMTPAAAPAAHDHHASSNGNGNGNGKGMGTAAVVNSNNGAMDNLCTVSFNGVHSSIDDPSPPPTAAVGASTAGNGSAGSGEGPAPRPTTPALPPGAEFSTWKFRSGGESKRVIDHMYWTEGRGLRPVSRWRMLSEGEIGDTGLPCEGYASDHIALCCEFEW